MISLTDEQKKAIDHQSNLLLSACPGSGKTRVILAKLLTLADTVVGSPQFIGCITYTNAAVDEIEKRLRTYGSQAIADKCEISTIHSFCLNFILRPYAWLIPEIPRAFRVITAEMSEFEHLVRAVEDEFFRTPTGRMFDDYASLRIDVNGAPCGQGFESGIVTGPSARRYWEVLCQHGYLDFSMILYYSLRLLTENSFVGRGVASRFSWLLIDEFQDTTDVQLAIFRKLQSYLHTKFFMVGDQNQSIMSFAGARPDLAVQFANDVNAERNLALSGNFRCGQGIIDRAEQLISRTPAMHPEGGAKAIVTSVQCEHVNRPVDAIVDYFLPTLEAQGIKLGDAAILAPWWTHLVPIARRLREFGVPVFGPGARPYQKRRLVAALAEQLGACAESVNYAGMPGVERALFRLVQDTTGTTRFDVFSYRGRTSCLALIYMARRLAAQHPGGVDWLRAMAKEAGDLLYTEEWIPAGSGAAFAASAEDMIGDMTARGVDLANLQISDLGLFANPDQALKLITLHNSKGREFDAVAMIHMNDGHIPHFASRSQAGYDEARRLFYVGMTRAKKVLIVASDATDRRNPPCIYISEAGLA